jgi:hypothetical protein
LCLTVRWLICDHLKLQDDIILSPQTTPFQKLNRNKTLLSKSPGDFVGSNSEKSATRRDMRISTCLVMLRWFWSSIRHHYCRTFRVFSIRMNFSVDLTRATQRAPRISTFWFVDLWNLSPQTSFWRPKGCNSRSRFIKRKCLASIIVKVSVDAIRLYELPFCILELGGILSLSRTWNRTMNGSVRSGSSPTLSLAGIPPPRSWGRHCNASACGRWPGVCALTSPQESLAKCNIYPHTIDIIDSVS